MTALEVAMMSTVKTDPKPHLWCQLMAFAASCEDAEAYTILTALAATYVPVDVAGNERRKKARAKLAHVAHDFLKAASLESTGVPALGVAQAHEQNLSLIERMLRLKSSDPEIATTILLLLTNGRDQPPDGVAALAKSIGRKRTAKVSEDDRGNMLVADAARAIYMAAWRALGGTGDPLHDV